MKRYVLKVCLPCNHNGWQAIIQTRQIEAEDLNDIIMRALSVAEVKRGARIIEVWEPLNDQYLSLQRVV